MGIALQGLAPWLSAVRDRLRAAEGRGCLDAPAKLNLFRRSCGRRHRRGRRGCRDLARYHDKRADTERPAVVDDLRTLADVLERGHLAPDIRRPRPPVVAATFRA